MILDWLFPFDQDIGPWYKGICIEHGARKMDGRHLHSWWCPLSIPAFNNTRFVRWKKGKRTFWIQHWFLTHWIILYTHFWQAHIWSSLVQSWSLSAYCTSLTPANIKLERILEAETVFGCQKRITLGIACRHLKTDSLHQMLWLPTIRKYCYQSAKRKKNKRIA